jgi:hypothetical protein
MISAISLWQNHFAGICFLLRRPLPRPQKTRNPRNVEATMVGVDSHRDILIIEFCPSAVVIKCPADVGEGRGRRVHVGIGKSPVDSPPLRGAQPCCKIGDDGDLH